jgi:FtsP/CotA-like multicopper oxidase with cupredoxin domain
MMLTRRKLIAGSAVATSAALLAGRARSALAEAPAESQQAQPPAAQAAGAVLSIEMPNGSTLPWKLVGGVKVYHLIAGPIAHEFMPGLQAECWGYNGQTPGPTIEAVQGDRVRFYVTNRLPEPTTVHWHGVRVPNGMDGVGGLTQRYIRSGETFKYEFTLLDAGTFMYHPHVDEMAQMGLGLQGMFIVHPKKPQRHVDRDFLLLLSEWKVPVGTRRPDPREMTDFNLFTINSKVFPATAPLVVRTGQRVRIRIGNLSAMHNHPIHLHGHTFVTTETDGGAIAASAQWPETTVLVPVGATRSIEFTAGPPGDWAMHCHFTHHVMNQMGHKGPNTVGLQVGDADTRLRGALPGYMTMGQSGMAGMGLMKMPVPDNSKPMSGLPGKHDFIDMGGMFTVLKVRDTLASYADPGWYENPSGTLAGPASAADLAADGIVVEEKSG